MKSFLASTEHKPHFPYPAFLFYILRSLLDPSYNFWKKAGFLEMGLSSKQVSSDGFDWSRTLEIQKSPSLMMGIRRHQHQQQQYLQNQPEQLKCPRCDSSNTKFCYYNNYNKSQPRHFCRTCKRHWTKGGTLRNVPIGGGRKNKRIKKSSSAATIASSNSMRRRAINDQISVQTQNQRQNFPLVSLGHQKNLSELLHHGLPASPPLHTLFNSGSLDGINYSADQRGSFLGSNSLPSFTLLNSSSSYETKPFQISTSFQSSDIYNYSQDQVKTIDLDPTNSIAHPTNLPTNPSSIINDMANVWNWEDADNWS